MSCATIRRSVAQKAITTNDATRKNAFVNCGLAFNGSFTMPKGKGAIDVPDVAAPITTVPPDYAARALEKMEKKAAARLARKAQKRKDYRDTKKAKPS